MKTRCCRSPGSAWRMWMRPRGGEDHDVGRPGPASHQPTIGLTFTVGDGTSDAAMTFTGTVANVNAALARVDYLGNANYSGADTLSISVDDQGNTGSGGAKTRQQVGRDHRGGGERCAGADGSRCEDGE